MSYVHPLMNHDGYYHVGIRGSHNLWLSILAELGLIGMAAFLFFVQGLFREIVRLLRGALSPLQANLTVALAIYFIVKLVDFNLNPQLEENLFWFGIGLLGALGIMAEPERAERPQTSGD